jgi:hypothetical protein
MNTLMQVNSQAAAVGSSVWLCTFRLGLVNHRSCTLYIRRADVYRETRRILRRSEGRKILYPCSCHCLIKQIDRALWLRAPLSSVDEAPARGQVQD